MSRKQKQPLTFEKRGTAYVGSATAIKLGDGREVIIMAANEEDLVEIGLTNFDQELKPRMFQRAAMVHESKIDADGKWKDVT